MNRNAWKKREIANLNVKYPQLKYLNLSFNDVYKLKQSITDMSNASPAFHDFWSQNRC